MDFIVDESRCRELSANMLEDLNSVSAIVSAIDEQNGTLKAALGDDYEAIAKSVRVMSSELLNAYSELKVIIEDMNEYISRVQQARVSLDSLG